MTALTKKGVSLVIIMRHNEPYVDDVILTSTPIKNIQTRWSVTD